MLSGPFLDPLFGPGLYFLQEMLSETGISLNSLIHRDFTLEGGILILNRNDPS